MKAVSKFSLTLLTMYLSLLLALSPNFVYASHVSQTKDLTPSPPVVIAPQGFFDPSFEFLDQGDSSIIDNGDQTVEVKVSTVAKKSVSSIGASIYLERWTGNSWVQIGHPALVSASDKMLFSGHATFSVQSGYYYRARTVHWTSHNGVYEQGERLTKTILAQ